MWCVQCILKGRGFSGCSEVKNPPTSPEVQSLGWKDPLDRGMATNSSILVWRIPLTEEPGRLQSMWLQRVGRDWVSRHQWWHTGMATRNGNDWHPCCTPPSAGVNSVKWIWASLHCRAYWGVIYHRNCLRIEHHCILCPITPYIAWCIAVTQVPTCLWNSVESPLHGD